MSDAQYAMTVLDAWFWATMGVVAMSVLAAVIRLLKGGEHD